MMHFQYQFINDSVKGSELCWYKLMVFELANKHASTLAISLETLPFILTRWILYSVFHRLSYRMSKIKETWFLFIFLWWKSNRNASNPYSVPEVWRFTLRFALLWLWELFFYKSFLYILDGSWCNYLSMLSLCPVYFWGVGVGGRIPLYFSEVIIYNVRL